MPQRRPGRTGPVRLTLAVALLAIPGGSWTGARDEPARGGWLPPPPPEAISEEDLRESLRREEAGLIEARVLLRTGREFVGLLIREEERKVTLSTRGEHITLDLADAIEFERLGPVLETYRALRAATPDQDTPARVYLVNWLRDRGAYLAAMDEAQSILDLEPFNHEVNQIHTWLTEQVRLRLRATARDAAPTPGQDEGPARRRIHQFPVLTPEEINLIRVYEVDFANPPRLLISRSVVEQFIDLYSDHELMPRTAEGRQALLRRDPLTVLDLMFRVQARPLYGEVRVQEDPAALRLFREQVHRTWLVGSNSSCASSACHGGQEAGMLYLNNARINQDATVYTNFFIMERFRLKDGTPLINYEEPAESPLLQMALPRERSRHPHPEVGRTEGRRGWRPYFRDEDDLRFKRAVEWIRAMYKPRPNYPIDYVPPVPKGVLRMENAPPPGER
jgi:hypothetical protein